MPKMQGLDDLENTTREMMEAGEAVLADPVISPEMKKLVMIEMENQRNMMDLLREIE